MFPYVVKGAKCMCTGCPGAPANLDVNQNDVLLEGKPKATIDDKKLIVPFATCLAIPTAPKPCNPSLVKWANEKADKKVKKKNALLFPNMIACTTGPGMVTLVDPGQKSAVDGSLEKKEEEYPCVWEGCNKSPHPEDPKIRFPLQEFGIVTKEGKGQSKGSVAFTGPWVSKSGVPSGVHPSTYERSIYGWRESPDRKDSDGKTISRTNYSIQKHHVIPVNSSLPNTPKLKENLRLLGWDANHYDYNGIELPSDVPDIYWHDLPRHNGGHTDYSMKVSKMLDALQKISLKLCAKNNHYDLYGSIGELVNRCRKGIVNWESAFLFNSKSLGYRVDAVKMHADRVAEEMNKIPPGIGVYMSHIKSGREFP